jgi:C4-type Zn-finger protein
MEGKMKCPMCGKNMFIELESWEPDYMGYGWSIKECMNCGYKVKDKILDGRFAGIDYVIKKPRITKQS